MDQYTTPIFARGIGIVLERTCSARALFTTSLGAAGREEAGNQPYAGTKNRAPGANRVVTMNLICA